jgi:hypothetical protein
MSVRLGNVTGELYRFALHLYRVQQLFCVPASLTPGLRGIKLRREIT